MESIEHIRHRPGMYIGDTHDPTKLLIECLDNALDEVQNGEADKIIVSVDNNTHKFSVSDNGRGFPYDMKRPIDQDPPVLSTHSIYTSGKFKKEEDESAYKVAAGLHGVGLTAVHALSNSMQMTINKKNKRAIYNFYHDQPPERKEEKSKSTDNSFSTTVTAYPSEKYFETLDIDTELVKERLIIAAANFEKLKIVYIVNNVPEKIWGTEDDLIRSYLGSDVDQWFKVEHNNKDGESYTVKVGWDNDESSTKFKTFTSVNFVKVSDGIHVSKVLNSIRSVLSKYAKKYKYEFQDNDIANWMRLYINLKIVDVHFDGQIKEKLSRQSNLDILDNFESKFESLVKDNIEYFQTLLEKFEIYRKSIQNKKLVKNNKSNKRGSAKFTKLSDCTQPGGELLISEGDSAGGLLLSIRDRKKHAVLPLRGVPMNVVDTPLSTIMKNAEIKDIITAIGCGVEPNCDITKLRYSKIIIAADADDAGYFICTLLITLFAKLTPKIIQEGKLYICRTPLYGYGTGTKFTPIWEEEERFELQNQGHKIRRFKGLGGHNALEIKKFTMDEDTRKLIQVDWSHKNADKIFKLMSSPVERRKLALDEWEL